jgi:photosystem II stability/assembly factor-like uncharacterized protein
MYKFFISLLLLFVSANVLLAEEWENLNPGSGGTIQDISLDPNTFGRVFVCTGKSGVFRSDNNGESWTYLGRDQQDGHTLTLKVSPANSKKIYVGTVSGLEISSDGGNTWAKQIPMLDEPISNILIDPSKSNIVYAAPGKGFSWAKNSNSLLAKPSIGKRGIYVSYNKGKTWKYVIYEKEEGRRDVIDLFINPADSKQIYLAAFCGLYTSKDSGMSWERLGSPEKTGDCWGADISPDGKVIYAAFRSSPDNTVPEKTVKDGLPEKGLTMVFASTDQGKTWQSISRKDRGFYFGPRNNLNYWKPRVDPRSTKTEHKILIAPWTHRIGLYEVKVSLEKDKIDDYYWRKVFYYDPVWGPAPAYDIGWEKFPPKPMVWKYAPTSWAKNSLWVGCVTSIFAVDAGKPDFSRKWSPKYTKESKKLDGTWCYTNRGLQSSTVNDCQVFKNYAIQACEGIGILESWDDGVSWSMETFPLRTKQGDFICSANAVAILDKLKVSVALAHASYGLDEDHKNGMLFAKKLFHYSPKDRWVLVGGGSEQLAGLPNVPYTQIVTDPQDKNKFYIGTDGKGIYMVEDVKDLFGKGKALLITGKGGPLKINEGSAMFVDPFDSNIIWVASGCDIFKGVRQKGTWDFTVAKKNCKGCTNISVWGYDNKTYIACVVGKKSENQWIELSTDNGKTWNKVIDFKQVVSKRKPLWYKGYRKMSVSGLVGLGNNICFAYTNAEDNRGFGIFKVTVGTGKESLWEDITGMLELPVPTKAKMIFNNGSTYLYAPTNGGGLWRKKLRNIFIQTGN